MFKKINQTTTLKIRTFTDWRRLIMPLMVLGLAALCLLSPSVSVAQAALTAQAAPSENPTVVSTTKMKELPVCEPGATNPDGTRRSYQDYALCMGAEIDLAIKAFEKKDYPGTLEGIDKAYFGWYENALEPPSMTLPGNRKVKMEGRFTRVKLAVHNSPEDASIKDKLIEIKTAVARDAMVLDGVVPDTSPESIGKQLLISDKPTKTSDYARNSVDLITSMTLLIREGLEAILVVVAIILYLVKSGNKNLVKAVYYGVVAAIAGSFLLAWLLHMFLGGAGTASELLEGVTMFIAVAMLFYVSNWMLSKTSGQNWQNYIQGMVHTSVSTGAARALVLAAFLAVIREGAELVLFYTAAFADGSHSPLWIGLGFAIGVVVLVVVFVIFRFGAVRLPVRAIFMGTSILLFIMCISFVGKGVQELKEANIIIGTTNLPWIKYYFPDLGIYPQAETLLPQLILFIASVWIILHHVLSNRKTQSTDQVAKKEGADHAESHSSR